MFNILNNFKFGKKDINLIFNYDFNNKYLTESYKLFNEYIKNPDIFVLQNINSELKWLVNSFEKIQNIVLNIDKNDNNLLRYYITLQKEFDTFTHMNLLFIIYQLIIPYMYLNYNIDTFLDYF